jgi:hypothetical protein
MDAGRNHKAQVRACRSNKQAIDLQRNQFARQIHQQQHILESTPDEKLLSFQAINLEEFDSDVP